MGSTGHTISFRSLTTVSVVTLLFLIRAGHGTVALAQTPIKSATQGSVSAAVADHYKYKALY